MLGARCQPAVPVWVRSKALFVGDAGIFHLDDLSRTALHLWLARTAHLKGYDRLTWFGGRNYTSNQATTLRRIPEVRVGQLIAERVQVGGLGSKFTDQMGCSSLVALRRVSTQRTKGHADAEGEDREAFSSMWVKFAGRCRLVTEDRDNEALELCWTLQ
eukprot:4096619-Pleurochrysis_carterae.AAC.2